MKTLEINLGHHWRTKLRRRHWQRLVLCTEPVQGLRKPETELLLRNYIAECRQILDGTRRTQMADAPVHAPSVHARMLHVHHSSCCTTRPKSSLLIARICESFAVRTYSSNKTLFCLSIKWSSLKCQAAVVPERRPVCCHEVL